MGDNMDWVNGSIVLGVLVAAAAVWALRVLRTPGRRLDAIWPQIHERPVVALVTLQSVIRQLERTRERAERAARPAAPEVSASLMRARVGATLCYLALSRIAEAEECESAARTLGSWLPDWTGPLCSAWLKANPVVWPTVAQRDLVDYVGLPATAQQVDQLDQVQAIVLRLTDVDGHVPAERLQAVIELGQQVLAVAPQWDEVQFRLGQALRRLQRFAEARPHL
jgi:hypothetical protein